MGYDLILLVVFEDRGLDGDSVGLTHPALRAPLRSRSVCLRRGGDLQAELVDEMTLFALSLISNHSTTYPSSVTLGELE